MSNSNFSKSYDPDITEEKWYDFWERNGFFHADPLSEKPPYCIVLPPPNVTGILHMGHALVNTLQDVLIRWKRMLGYEVLWVPGTDHAGISTQTIVEKDLLAKRGERRCDYDRDTFLDYVWKWKERHEKEIVAQLKRLGCSCDWMRHRFTMDRESNLAVRTLFKKMYDDGLIYQGDYLVNWDPITQTALADDEVEYEEKRTKLYYLRYPLEGVEDAHLTIATTRPETMLGDVAVAVAPGDTRYALYVGKCITLPIAHRTIPVIADESVNPKFGTGVVKITPAHDFNDWETGRRHALPLINILNPDGTLNENGLEYQGLSVNEARRHIVEKMRKIGCLEREEPHTHRVGISYRSKAVIEPLLSKQWFIKMQPFKQRLIDAVKEGRVVFTPKNRERSFLHWIENICDWCISRQLWWGHRIPIWKNASGEVLCCEGEDIPPQFTKGGEEWSQDDDVLDTWFSSSLWPFSALGWPHCTNELKKFYPNSTLVTGHDILFFWVARMIMMGEYVMGAPPFSEVSLQGLIYGKSYFQITPEGNTTYIPPRERRAFDSGASLPEHIHSKWEKMSKSKGNVIDPVEIMDTYGTDAMRIALVASATESFQIDLDLRRIEEFKNFINKVWNGARFVLTHLTLSSEDFMEELPEELPLEDRWILSLLNRTIKEMNAYLRDYRFNHAALCMYHFFWDQFCAYYVELAKPLLFSKSDGAKIKQKLLVIVLLSAIRLMHPITPFISEEIFHLLKGRFSHIKKVSHDPYTREAIDALLSPACVVSHYPQIIHGDDIDPQMEERFAFIGEIVSAIRNIRAEMQIAPALATDVWILGDIGSIGDNPHIISSLVPIHTLNLNTKDGPQEFAASTHVRNLKVFVPLPEALRDKERLRLQKKRDKLDKQITSLTRQLSNPTFVERAPKELVTRTKKNLVDAKQALDEITEKLSHL